MNMNISVDNLKGVGPKVKENLNKIGIFTLMDLLLYFPRDYENIKAVNGDEKIDDGEKVAINVTVAEIKRDMRTGNGKLITTVVFKAGEEIIHGKWFNQSYAKNSFKINEKYHIFGKIKKYKGINMISSPKIINGEVKESRIIPKYSLTQNLNSNIILKLINQILNSANITENLPEYILEKYKLCPLDYAIRNIHYPDSMESLRKAMLRLKFQELFTYSIKVLMLKYYVKNNKKGIAYKISDELIELKNKLPFKLTEAQNKAIREILIDQKKGAPMNRLLQGDVGSGKTIIAIISMFNVVKNGYQCALIVPTEILAVQHFEEVKKILGSFNVNVELLTGSTKQKKKMEIKEGIKDGSINIVIGTHALIQDDVEFSNLGMIIADEQHRFGVNQRAKLINKNSSADVLVMSATPIPRTLALYVYGDLDISVVNELPPGRKPISTMFFDGKKKEEIYSIASEEIDKGRQVYIVCPLIEENDELELNSVNALYEVLKNGEFSNYTVEIIHGKMKQAEKDDVMQRFKNNQLKVLISTTVIEVGVNVPNASVMIIENAERFGLSQLHQLRGRVGRGQHQSYCLLTGSAKSKNTKKRMQIMVETNDGFVIAEEDLKLRGTGQLFGIKQSGENEFILSDIFEDIDILKAANIEAHNLINNGEFYNIGIKNEVISTFNNSAQYICFN